MAEPQPLNSTTSTVVPLLDIKNYVGSSELAIKKYIELNRLDRNPDIVDIVVDTMTNSVVTKVTRLTKFANKENNYYYGLPKASESFHNNEDLLNESINHINNLEGTTVELIASSINTKNLYYAVWEKLYGMLGYSGLNNEIKVKSLSKNTKCYLVNAEIFINQATYDIKALKDNTENTSIPFSYGTCFGRVEDINRPSKPIVVSNTDRAEIEYAFSVPIDDTVPPPTPIVNYFNEVSISGYAEIGTTVFVYWLEDLIGSVNVDNEGLFTIAIPNVVIEEANPVVSIKCVDINNNESEMAEYQLYYENSNPALRGTENIGNYVIMTEKFDISLNDVVEEATKHDETSIMDWIQIFYKTNNQYKLFTYLYLSGDIPSIDNLANYETVSGEYMPRIYVRDKSVNLDTLSESDTRRKDTERLLRRLGMNLEELTKSVMDGIENVDDDFKYIYIDLVADLKTIEDDTEIAEYAYYWLNDMYLECEPIVNGDYLDSITLAGRTTGISKSVGDNEIAVSVTFVAAGKEVRSGIAKNSKGVNLKVGEYCSTLYPFTYTVLEGRGTIHTYARDFIYQINSNQHVVLTIIQLTTSQRFSAGGGETGANAKTNIPVDLNYLDRLSHRDRERFINKCLKLNVLTYTEYTPQKGKWYETGIFEAFMAVVSISINYLAPGVGSSISGLLTSAAVQLAASVIVDIAINELVKVAIKLGASVEVASLIGALGSVAASNTIQGKGGTGFLNAKEVMSTVNKTFNIYSKELAKELANLKKDATNFVEGSKDKYERLEAAQELLDTGISSSDFLLVGTSSELGITKLTNADEFFEASTFVDVSAITTNIVDSLLYMASDIPVSPYTNSNRLEEVEDALLVT